VRREEQCEEGSSALILSKFTGLRVLPSRHGRHGNDNRITIAYELTVEESLAMITHQMTKEPWEQWEIVM
jgi:hypothetical protein